MSEDSTNNTTDPAQSDDDSGWGAPLWDDSWEGQTGQFGDAHLCVATKTWGDGTVHALVAHDPHDDEGTGTTAYAHRHGHNVTPLTVHGPATEVVKTVTQVWGPPQTTDTTVHES